LNTSIIEEWGENEYDKWLECSPKYRYEVERVETKEHLKLKGIMMQKGAITNLQTIWDLAENVENRPLPWLLTSSFIHVRSCAHFWHGWPPSSGMGLMIIPPGTVYKQVMDTDTLYWGSSAGAGKGEAECGHDTSMWCYNHPVTNKRICASCTINIIHKMAQDTTMVDYSMSIEQKIKRPVSYADKLWCLTSSTQMIESLSDYRGDLVATSAQSYFIRNNNSSNHYLELHINNEQFYQGQFLSPIDGYLTTMAVINNSWMLAWSLHQPAHGFYIQVSKGEIIESNRLIYHKNTEDMVTYTMTKEYTKQKNKRARKTVLTTWLTMSDQEPKLNDTVWCVNNVSFYNEPTSSGKIKDFFKGKQLFEIKGAMSSDLCQPWSDRYLQVLINVKDKRLINETPSSANSEKLELQYQFNHTNYRRNDQVGTVRRVELQLTKGNNLTIVHKGNQWLLNVDNKNQGTTFMHPFKWLPAQFIYFHHIQCVDNPNLQTDNVLNYHNVNFESIAHVVRNPLLARASCYNEQLAIAFLQTTINDPKMEKLPREDEKPTMIINSGVINYVGKIHFVRHVEYTHNIKWPNVKALKIDEGPSELVVKPIQVHGVDQMSFSKIYWLGQERAKLTAEAIKEQCKHPRPVIEIKYIDQTLLNNIVKEDALIVGHSSHIHAWLNIEIPPGTGCSLKGAQIPVGDTNIIRQCLTELGMADLQCYEEEMGVQERRNIYGASNHTVRLLRETNALLRPQQMLVCKHKGEKYRWLSTNPVKLYNQNTGKIDDAGLCEEINTKMFEDIIAGTDSMESIWAQEHSLESESLNYLRGFKNKKMFELIVSLNNRLTNYKDEYLTLIKRDWEKNKMVAINWCELVKCLRLGVDGKEEQLKLIWETYKGAILGEQYTNWCNLIV